MHIFGTKMIATVASCMVFASSASASTFAVFDGITAGVADFDSTVTSGGGTVAVDVWSGLSSSTSVDRGDYTITNNDGAQIIPTTYGDMSGQVIGINPAGGGSDPRTDPLDYFNSGFTLTFDEGVNAVGFEVGDWATCCYNPVTELFISFDGGAPITVATANQRSDGQFPSQDNPNRDVFEIFVGAFDDTSVFTEVAFWGNGIGEYLVAGGQVRYAAIDEGSLPPENPNVVPLPAGLPLILVGIGAFAFVKRRKEA